MQHQHVVMMSGGITSWAAARRVADQHGTAGMVLLFADTNAEDPDLYRFLNDAATDIGVPITRVADGRTPQQVHEDVRLVGNAKIAPCSRVLKQEPCRRWLEANTDPVHTTVYVGIDWSELHRVPAIEQAYLPWRAQAPLCEPPYFDKQGWMIEARRRGVMPPRLYALGFPHNNCGGACVRGGIAQWTRLLEVFPDRFAAWEAHEERQQRVLGTDRTILRDRSDGTTKPLPLAVLRRRVEDGNTGRDELDFDWGGCGCLPA